VVMGLEKRSYDLRFEIFRRGPCPVVALAGSPP
jgi:hypothetical protein